MAGSTPSADPLVGVRDPHRYHYGSRRYPPTGRSGQPMRDVLVVDEDFVAAEIHRWFVEQVEGFRAAGVAQTGDQALSAARELRPLLILLDIYLPDMTGAGGVAALAIRERPRRRHHAHGRARADYRAAHWTVARQTTSSNLRISPATSEAGNLRDTARHPDIRCGR